MPHPNDLASPILYRFSYNFSAKPEHEKVLDRLAKKKPKKEIEWRIRAEPIEKQEEEEKTEEEEGEYEEVQAEDQDSGAFEGEGEEW